MDLVSFAFLFGDLIVTEDEVHVVILFCERYYTLSAAFWAFVALMCHGMVDTGITNRNALQSISAILGMAFASDNSRKL